MLCLVGWAGWRYIETITSACDCKDPVDGERVSLFNPFRDKAPEEAALIVVSALQTGKCERVSPAQTYCPEEFPPFSWKLTGRAVTGDKAVLRYWLVMNGTASTAPLYITLQKRGQYWNEVGVYTEF